MKSIRGDRSQVHGSGSLPWTTFRGDSGRSRGRQSRNMPVITSASRQAGRICAGKRWGPGWGGISFL